MKTLAMTLPELFLIVGTRALLGAGVALLISRFLTNEQRRAAGIALVAAGVLTTPPLVALVRGKCAAAKGS